MFAVPTRKRATSSMGRCVADKPMRTSFEFRVSSFEFRLAERVAQTSCFQAFDGEREVRTAFVADDGMNLIED